MDGATVLDDVDSQWPDIDLPDGASVSVGRSRDNAVVLSHGSISRNHARLRRAGNHLQVQDLGSRFGTLVNGHPIKVMGVNRDDTLRFGSGPSYRFDGSRLVVDRDAHGMALDLVDVGLTRGRRCLLHNVNAHIDSGSFVGVLGPSGGGKSLLLGCLSDTITPDEGAILFDGDKEIAGHREYYRSKIGFVPQEDLVYDRLTVAENLWFSAKLRYPHAPPEQLRERVDNALEAVDMTRHRGKLASVLSGGQKKRVSVAVELITRPRLLLLDEPTSGLDPGTQFRLMDILRRLARQGLTVVCVTHTTDTLHFFDSLLVLGFRDGSATVVRHEPPDKLLSSFQVRSLPDLFDKLQAESAPAPETAATRIAPPAEPKPPSGTSGSANTKRPALRGVPNAVYKRPDAEGRYLRIQAATVARRTALCTWRDRGGTLLALGLPVALALLIAFTQCQQVDTTFASFFLVVSSLWLGMTLSVREIVKERKLFVRERLAGLAASSFMGGKLAFMLGAVLAQAFLLLGVFCLALMAAGSLGIDNEATYGNWLPPYLGYPVLVMVGFGGVLLGLCVSTIATSEQTAVGFLPLLLLPQVLVSKVAVGDGAAVWRDAGRVFSILTVAVPNLVAKLGELVSGDGVMWNTLWELALFLCSLPQLTRPGTAALGMYGNESMLTPIVVEMFYLLVLLALHFLAWCWLFSRNQKTWSIR